MTEKYDDAVAQHYATFRPPLHWLILGRALRPEDSFRSGLDIGCGTGYSAVALTEHCGRVVGLDVSQAMLDKAQSHPQVTYVEGRGDRLQQFSEGAFDIITFAGSLFYTKSEQLRTELLRVGTPGGLIVVYDFEVHLEELMRLVGLSIPAVSSDYDHTVGLDGWTEYALVSKAEDRLRLDVSEIEAAHVLLADSNRYDAIARRFPGREPFESLVVLLTNHREACALYSTIYFASYRFLKAGK